VVAEEIWKDIKGWAFHQVSNYGRVRALPGARVKTRIIAETELRILSIDKRGYVVIHRSGGAKVQQFFVHRLVLETFDTVRPFGYECRHLNGNRADNRWPDNIEWGTPKKNQEDRIAHGTDGRGERHPGARLTQSDVVDIRSRPKSRQIATQLAIQYGVSARQIRNIRNGIKWKSV
jgi:hypothetical protein